MDETQWKNYPARAHAIAWQVESGAKVPVKVNIWWDGGGPLDGRWVCQVLSHRDYQVMATLSKQVDQLDMEFVDTATLRISTAWIREIDGLL